jgi:hypothetical protein
MSLLRPFVDLRSPEVQVSRWEVGVDADKYVASGE